ncbi:MAG: hypothetical protein HQL64_07980 [Magnetococcales bacterium]|nr:hypothetical protein [Magnetococcales bacterium]
MEADVQSFSIHKDGAREYRIDLDSSIWKNSEIEICEELSCCLIAYSDFNAHVNTLVNVLGYTSTTVETTEESEDYFDDIVQSDETGSVPCLSTITSGESFSPSDETEPHCLDGNADDCSGLNSFEETNSEQNTRSLTNRECFPKTLNFFSWGLHANPEFPIVQILFRWPPHAFPTGILYRNIDWELYFGAEYLSVRNAIIVYIESMVPEKYGDIFFYKSDVLSHPLHVSYKKAVGAIENIVLRAEIIGGEYHVKPRDLYDWIKKIKYVNSNIKSLRQLN